MNQLLTLKEVAKFLNVKEFRAAELVRLKILPAVYLGKQVRVDEKQLAKFIAEGGRPLERAGSQA
jgi:excisionase family DNA binding protein